MCFKTLQVSDSFARFPFICHYRFQKSLVFHWFCKVFWKKRLLKMAWSLGSVLGAFLDRFWRLLEALGSVLGASWRVMEASWVILEVSWGLLEAS